MMSRFEEIHIRLPDQYAAYARYWSPPGPIAGVLYLHGIQSHCGWYEASARRLADAGFAVLQPDRRGSGHNRERRGHAASPGQLIDDARACLDELSRRTGLQTHHLLGVSWGGKLAAAMYVSRPAGIASLTLVTPGLFPIVDVPALDKFRIGWAMISDQERHFDIPLNDPELFTASPWWIEWLRNDELQLHRATAGFFLASRRLDRIALKLPNARAVPLNVFLAEDERIIDNARTRRFIRQMRWFSAGVGSWPTPAKGWPPLRITSYATARHTLEFESGHERYFDDLVSWFVEVTRGKRPGAD